MFGHDRLKITFPIYCLAGIMGVLPGAVRGLGYSTAPSLIAIFGACGVRIVWIYTIFEMFPSLSTLYLVHPITWVITNVALIITYIICHKKVKNRIMSSKNKVYVE
jgi:Na+-driven multidrug efflux pump